MIFNKILIYLIFLFYVTNIHATNIATIQIEYILSKSTTYNKFIQQINIKKDKFSAKLKIIENEILIEKKNLIDNSIIYDENENQILIEKYQKKTDIFQQKIDELNLFLSTNIERNRSTMIQYISSVAKEFSLSNNIDIIFDETNYFMSNSSIDISDIIIEQLNNISITLEIFNNDETLYN